MDEVSEDSIAAQENRVDEENQLIPSFTGQQMCQVPKVTVD